MNVMNVTDKEAMDELAEWMKDNDPILDGTMPNWVWDLVILVDDLIEDTGRKVYSDGE